jgi:outer membrane protein TolC
MTIEDELHAARVERDQAIAQLALARAELDALKRSLDRRGEPEPPLYPDATAPDLQPPLRYVLADALHARVIGLARLFGGPRAR